MEQTQAGLKITEAWLVWMTPLLIIFLIPGPQFAPILVLLGLLESTGNPVYLALLIGLGLLVGYIVLAAFFNKTVVSVSPEEIEITVGPLPWLGPQTRQLKAGTIHQVKVVNRLFGHELRAIYGEQRRSLTLLRMLGQTAAFYLEEEINDYLGLPLPAEPVPLPEGYKKEEWIEIYQFAKRHQLEFRVSKFSAAPVLSGLYEGYQLKINFFKRDQTRPLLVTRLHFSVVQREVLALPTLDQGYTASQVDQLLEPFLAKTSTPLIPGAIEIETGGQHLFYEESNLRIEPASLEALCQVMVELLKVYPRLVHLGGLTVARLQPPATLRQAFQPVVLQLLHDIARETQNRLAAEANRLFCPSCLRCCVPHEIKLSLLDRLTYYGCRACGQTLEFLPARKAVVAILDTRMTQKYISREDVLYGNWLLHRQSFDFDEVYIRQASDEEVERFAVQVGNDTDSLQQPRYTNMRCLVWPDANLSENSLKILRRTFGRVEMKAQNRQRLQEKAETSSFHISRLGSETEEGMAEDTQAL